MSNSNNFSKKEEASISLYFGEENKNNVNSKRKRVFEVFHKKEMIYSSIDPISKKTKKKLSVFKYRCIYCGNIYNNMNRFEAHMRIHVGKYYLFNIFALY